MAFIISLAILNIEISTSGLRRYILQSVITYALIIIAFIVGYGISGSLHIGYMLYVMLALFVVSMACFIRKMRKATNRHRRQTEKTSGADNMPYIRYSQAAITLLYVAGAILPITILSTTLLYIFGPFMLLSLVFFIQTFVALGYYYNPSEANTGRETPPPLLRKIPEERVRFIQKALDRWCLAGGYKDKSATMMSLAKQTTVSKEELSEYFSIYMNSSFRIWLSDMRFYRMQQMMIDFPQYSNDAISAECGFSSHAHLYKIFKVKTGMTPKQWKDTAIPVIPE